MASVKATLAGLGSDDGADEVSLLERLFGFAGGRVPADPIKANTASVSMLELLRDVEREHVNVNVVRVALDDWWGHSEQEAIEKLDWSILRLREIFRAVDLGVGRVEHWEIDLEDAEDMEFLGSKAEARELWREWSVYNDGIDVFVVRDSSAGWVGLSPRSGSCEKDSGRDGAVGGVIIRAADEVARTFAHELGHFLGLKHTHRRRCPTDPSELDNLMTSTKCVRAAGVDVRTTVDLTGEQGDDMRAHACVRSGIL